MKIISPMASGNGAYIIHSLLQEAIAGYQLKGYSPKWAFFPPSLPFIVNTASADLVHTTPDLATFFAKQDIPLVISLQNYVLDSFMRSFSTPIQKIHYATDLRYFHKKAVIKAHTITAVSQFTAELAKKDLGIDISIEIIHNGIDTDKFTPNFRQNNTISVLFAGNPTLRKGVQWLDGIASFLQPGIEILVTGGLRKSSYSFSNSRIKHLGHVPYESMPELYDTVDMLLFPTVREGLSLACIEAMSCGLPVATTKGSSMPELIIDGKGGHLCRLGDVKEFADSINKIAASFSKRKEMGEFNRQRAVEFFSLKKMVSSYKQLFERVLS